MYCWLCLSIRWSLFKAKLRSQGFCQTGQQFPTFQCFLQERWLHSNWLSLHLWGNGTLLQRSDWACVIPRIVADDVNPPCIFSFQLRCLTRVRPPTKAVRILQLWFICVDASDSLFCPSVISQRQSNTGSCDSGEGSCQFQLEQELDLNAPPNLQSGLELTRQRRPYGCNWAGPSSALWKKTERLWQQAVKVMLPATWYVVFPTVPSPRPITAHPAAAV